MLSKKDFIVLAEIIAESRVSEDSDYLENSLIEFCATQNPNFDVKRFEEWIYKTTIKLEGEIQNGN